LKVVRIRIKAANRLLPSSLSARSGQESGDFEGFKEIKSLRFSTVLRKKICSAVRSGGEGEDNQLRKNKA